MSESRPSSVEQCIFDITECPICNEVLQDNRCLPCLHTFCLKCLESYKKGKSKGKILPCPVCRREFPIPKCVADLPHNFIVDKLIDAHKIKTQPVSRKYCDICSEDTNDVPATRFCCACHQNLCLSCEKQHRKIKATALHKIVDNTNITDPQDLAPRATYCFVHTNKEAEVYCQDCKKVVCWKCKSVSHSDHSSTDIRSAAKDFAGKLEKHIEQISEHLRTKQNDVQNLQENEKLYTDEIDAEATNICRELSKLYKTITDNAEKLKKALTASTTDHLKTIHVLRDKLQTDIKALKNHKVYIEQMIHLGNVSDLCEYTDELISKTERMTEEKTCKLISPPVARLSDSDLYDLLTGRRTDIDQQYCNRYMNIAKKINDNREKLQDELQSTVQSKEWSNETSSIKLKLNELRETSERTKKKRNRPLSTKIKDMMPSMSLSRSQSKDRGDKEQSKNPSYEQHRDQHVDNGSDDNKGKKQDDRQSTDQTKGESTSTPDDWSLINTVRPENGAAVCGVTVLDSKMYIVLQNRNNIQVYDSVDFKFLKNVPIARLLSPNDIASCKFNNCLYVCDWGTTSIFRVDINKEMGYVSWGLDGDIGGLSVTTEHSILLAGYVSNKLKEYKSNGELIRCIDLEDGLKPWHAISLVSNYFLICHGGLTSEFHRVGIVGLDGRLATVFGEVKGSDEEHLCGPYHLAVNNGCVLVNDCNNRRIVLLSPFLRFIKELIPSTSDLLRRARRMFLDKEVGRLYVADNITMGGETRDGRILVFKISMV